MTRSSIMKAAARPAPSAGKADGESAVLAALVKKAASSGPGRFLDDSGAPIMKRVTTRRELAFLVL